MAVLILDNPTTPNVTGTDLIYTVDSDKATQPQFRFVTDVYESGSGDYLTTIRTYPNLYGTANINLKRELEDQLTYLNEWEVGYNVAMNGASKTFDLRFGEEYATTLNTSRSSYPGTTPNYLQVFPGITNEQDSSTGYNFPSGSFIPTGNTPAEGWYGDQALTSDPYKLTSDKAVYPWANPIAAQPKPFKIINHNDYETLSFLSGELNSGDYQPHEGVMTVYSGSVELIYRSPLWLNSDYNAENGVCNTPAGPQNVLDYTGGTELDPLKAIFNLGEDAWTHYIIGVRFRDGEGVYTDNYDGYWYINDRYLGANNLEIDGTPLSNYQWDNISSNCEGYTRFAFINAYGVYDYQNVYLPKRRVTDIKRNMYTRSFVRYEDCVSEYNASNRGSTQYYTEYTDKYEITTDWLDKEMANWLQQLIESPQVFVQENGKFVPIALTNSSYKWNNETSRNKLFQYTIEFVYANQREPR